MLNNSGHCGWDVKWWWAVLANNARDLKWWNSKVLCTHSFNWAQLPCDIRRMSSVVTFCINVSQKTCGWGGVSLPRKRTKNQYWFRKSNRRSNISQHVYFPRPHKMPMLLFELCLSILHLRLAPTWTPWCFNFHFNFFKGGVRIKGEQTMGWLMNCNGKNKMDASFFPFSIIIQNAAHFRKCCRGNASKMHRNQCDHFFSFTLASQTTQFHLTALLRTVSETPNTFPMFAWGFRPTWSKHGCFSHSVDITFLKNNLKISLIPSN